MNAGGLSRQGLLLLLGGFLILALLGWGIGEASEVWATSPDRQLLAAVDAHRSGVLTSMAAVLTTLGSGAVLLPLTALVLLVLLRRRRPLDALFLAVAVVGAFALLFLVKDLVDRSRPPVLHLVGTRSSSFPSAHSGDALAFYGGLATVVASGLGRGPRVGVWAIAVLGVLGVGWSRLYLGVHYPSDVAGAYLLATAWLVVSSVGFRHPR